MIIRIITFILLVSFLPFQQLFSQNRTEIEKANEYLKRKHEVYFKFNITSKDEIKTLTKIISIDNVINNVVYAYANSREFKKFLELNYTFTVLPHPGDNQVEMYNHTKGIWQFDTYPTYTDFLTMMSTYQTNYPNLFKIVQIGTTVNGRQLLCAKLTDSVNVTRKVPKFMYISSVHGDETTGYVLMMELINYLLTNYGTIQRITNLLDSMEIWIMPLGNPDGTYYGGNSSVTGSIRYNGNNEDLNRNYKNPVMGDHPDAAAWQPETIALMNLADSVHFVMSCVFHGGAEVVNYPWDSWDSYTMMHADDTWWEFISHEYADTVHAVSSSYMNSTAFNNGITNGGDWYIVYGSHQDYMNYYKYSRAITIELSNTKTPVSTTIPTYWSYNHASFLNYIEQATYGIRGTVKDSCTGSPVVAKIYINSHDTDGSWIYSDSLFGDYYRPVYAGTYSLTYSATGYHSKTLTNISVSNYQKIVRNVVLSVVTPGANFVADHVTSCSGVINFTNTSNATANSSWLWNFGDGNTDSTFSPSHTYLSSGTYSVSLQATNCSGSNQIVKSSYITINLPAAPVTVPTTVCDSGITVLSASGSGKLNWYNSQTGGTIINTGTTFTTPVLTSTTTYYVQDEITSTPVYGAKPNNSGGGGYLTNTAQYLIFDCYSPLTLVTVDIYANSTGPRTIELRNNSGSVIQSATVSIPVTGLNTVILNFSIPAGSNLQLGLQSTSTCDLYRNNNAAGISYPYITTGLVSVTSSNAGTSYYYWFYNWHLVQSSCFSSLSPVTATVIPTISPLISISTQSDTICRGDTAIFYATISGGGITPSYQWLINGSVTSNVYPFITTLLNNNDTVSCILTSSEACVTSLTDTSNKISLFVDSIPVANFSYSTNNQVANFTNTSVNGASYNWNFGDSTYSSNFSPTHTYQHSGTFNVILTAFNSCGSDSVVIPVTIVISGINNNSGENINIYPNPAKDILYILCSDIQAGEVIILFYDLIGNEIYNVKYVDIMHGFFKTVDLSAYFPGVYFVKIIHNDKVNIKKVVVK